MAVCMKCRGRHERTFHGRVKTTCTGHHMEEDKSLRACMAFPMHGQMVCSAHGGLSPQAKAKGEERQQEEKIRALAATLGDYDPDADPQELILEQIRWSAGHVAWFRARIQALDPDILFRGTRRVTRSERSGWQEGTSTETEVGPGLNLWLEAYDRERKYLTDLCAKAVALGIEARRVELAERHTDMLLDGLQWLVSETGTRQVLDESGQAALMELVGEMLQRLSRLEESAPKKVGV